MKTAFFSYSRDDSDFVHRLAQDLKMAGLKVWLDQLDIVPGQRWDRAIEEALARSSVMLVVLSSSSVKSENVRDEVSFGLKKGKIIIPVVYKDCEIPFRLDRLQHVDFTRDYGRGLSDLVKALAASQDAEQSAPLSVEQSPQSGQRKPEPNVQQGTQGANSPSVIGDHTTINYNLKDPKVSAKLDEITKLLKEQANHIKEEDLLKKYPLGYVIVDVDKSNQVFPYKSKAILANYEIDWTGVGVDEGPPGRITLHLPSLRTQDGKSGFTSASTGGPKRVGNLGGAMVNGLMEWGEILAISKEGIVFLVGFDQGPRLPR
jgi:hypothetical protein